MTDTHATAVTNVPNQERPPYQVREFGAASSIEHWLNENPDYRLVSLTPISVTNHFSKETETTVYMVAELRDRA
jgi:hypothetical protein